ncbi:MAG TPA: hypothetical protein VK437_16285, partial [Steroidobacteraceae bacterium]|nr:hypothetical protein [Steroidobacteraceae bacterium]
MAPDVQSADGGSAAAHGTWGLLPHFGIARFSGPDAIAFLQGQLSNDMRRLGAGASLLAALSSPQGRVVSVMHLMPHSSGIVAVLPREMVAPSLERLRKFVLRAKVKLEELTEEFAVIGAQGSGLGGIPAPDAAANYRETGGVGVSPVRPQASSRASRYLIIGPRAELAQEPLRGLARLRSAAGPVEIDAERSEQEWRLADIRSGVPQVYASTSEMFVAQMLNLDLIDGISFSKGCYTGQEIIARTQHLGRIKRRLSRLAMPQGHWSIGQALRLADGRSGR